MTKITPETPNTYPWGQGPHHNPHRIHYAIEAVIGPVGERSLGYGAASGALLVAIGVKRIMDSTFQAVALPAEKGSRVLLEIMRREVGKPHSNKVLENVAKDLRRIIGAKDK